MVPQHYSYRHMSAVDLPMIRRWLETSEVAQWWGDPNEQFALVSEDLAHPAMDQFVVALDDRAFAYLQCCDPMAWPENGFGEQPNGARGIDQFIGEPDMIGHGHGSAMIRGFVDNLLNRGTPRVLTDPDPENIRAVSAYDKAEFQKTRLVDIPDGRALLMVGNA
jgi:aminoglycoside 6'-N-acetyltransferase